MEVKIQCTDKWDRIHAKLIIIVYSSKPYGFYGVHKCEFPVARQICISCQHFSCHRIQIN